MILRKIVSLPASTASALRVLVGEHRFQKQLIMRNEGLRIGKGVEIRSPDRLKLGKNVTIETGVVLHCGGFEWCGFEGGITIGDNCYIGPNSVLFGSGGIEMGDHVALGPGVVIAAQQVTQHDTPVVERLPKFAPIKIGNNVSIASNATILQGVTIGDHSVIGAGTVITKDVAPYSLMSSGGARKVRDLQATAADDSENEAR